MEHNHSHMKKNLKKSTKSRLLFAIFFNVIITAVEVAGGLISGSLSLLSDALHNFSDVVAIVISYLAMKLTEVENSPGRTFGLRRSEVFAALINAVVLIGVSIFLFREAIYRFFSPVEIEGSLMLWVAVVGLFGNLLSVLILKRDAEKSMNIRSAFLHLVADTVSSIAVIGGAIAIIFYDFYLIDPILTLLIGIYVLKESYEILSKTVRILMQVAPVHLDVYEIKDAIEELEEVDNVHHVHLWQLNEDEVFFEGHVETSKDTSLSRACSTISRVEKLLKERFNISHVTIQIEYMACEDKSVIKKTGAKN